MTWVPGDPIPGYKPPPLPDGIAPGADPGLQPACSGGGCWHHVNHHPPQAFSWRSGDPTLGRDYNSDTPTRRDVTRTDQHGGAGSTDPHPYRTEIAPR